MTDVFKSRIEAAIKDFLRFYRGFLDTPSAVYEVRRIIRLCIYSHADLAYLDDDVEITEEEVIYMCEDSEYGFIEVRVPIAA